MRCSDRLKSQRGFSLMEVMAAAIVLSIFVTALGAIWIMGDRRVNALVVRQKAIFVANMEMERLTTLYGTTMFGGLGPVSTTGYTTTSATTFASGDSFQVYVSSNLLSSLNRSYVWIDKAQGTLGRISWTTTN